MKDYPAVRIRNIALLGHGGSGKTTFAEAVMFNAKAIDRFGKVADGNTTMDFDAEEIRRKFSINTALAAIEWNDCKINLLDTPGYFDFVGEVYQGLRVADGAVVLVPAKDGVAVGTEKSVKYLRDRGLPVVFFIGKMDEENANFERSLTQLQTNFGNQVKPFFLPILEGGKMKGFVDILTQKAFMNGANGVATEAPIPAGMVDEAAVALEAMKEHAAESDEALMEKFFSGEEFTPEEMLKGLSESIVAGTVYPVFCGSAGANWGMRIVMDRLVALLPTAISAATVPAKRLDGSETSVKIDPTGPLAAIVFKTIADPFVGRISMFRVYSGVLKANSTVYNPVTEKDERVGSLFLMIGKKQVLTEQVAAGDIGAVTKLIYTSTNDTLCEKAKPVLLPRTEFPTPCLSMAVEGKAKGDDEKISAGLHKLKDEDPVFTMGYNAETHQLLLAGIGEQHLDVLISKLKSKFNVEATLIEPRVPYRETIRKKVRVEGKHKKQSGGHGQFGHVWVEFEPGPAEGLTFEEHIFGGSVPKQYHPGVEKGLQDAIKKGVLAGYPMVHLKASLVDGSYHDVDSSEMAFKIAARLAYKAGIPLAGPVLLEPICTVDVYIPDSNLGDIMGDMNKRRGRIVGVNPIEHGQEVVAEVPQSEMAKYANDLRSMTQGRGWYKIAFARYDTAPQLISDKVIAEAKLHMKEEEEED
jgi:elongation factor G